MNRMNPGAATQPMEVILITSGKGGAGCSTIASAIGMIAARREVRTLLIELSSYSSSQSLFANATAAAQGVSTSSVSANDSLDTAASIPLQPNLELLWGSRHVASRANELANRIAAERRAGKYSLVIIDLAAGEPFSDRQIASLATLTILVAIPDLASLAATFGLFKNLTAGTVGRIGLLVNRMADEGEANDLSLRFSSLCEKFTGRLPETFAPLPLDLLVNSTQSLQQSVITNSARSSFARRIERLTERMIPQLKSRPVTSRIDQSRPINMKRNLADIKD